MGNECSGIGGAQDDDGIGVVGHPSQYIEEEWTVIPLLVPGLFP